MDNLAPVQIHGITIDAAKWKVLVEGVPVSLTSYQFRLLHFLASNAGRTLTRQQIIEHIHGLDYPVSERSVNVQVLALRRRLGDLGRLIETERGVGYRFQKSFFSGVCPMMWRRTVQFERLLTLALLAFCPLRAWAEDAAAADARLLARKLPGAQPGGSVLLPNQWSLRPAGRQIEVGNFPVNMALHPRGRWAAILHSGYGPHAIVVVDVTAGRIVSSVIVPRTFYGLCFSPGGERLFASGGEDDVVHEFHFADGYLDGHKVIELPKSKTALVAAGLACSLDGSCLYAACCLGDRLCILRPDRAGDRRQIDLPARSYPYLPVVARKTNRLYLSLWGKSAVAVIDLDQRAVSSHLADRVASDGDGSFARRRNALCCLRRPAAP